MLFWKEHKDDTECMHCGRSRYVNVVNEDVVSITIKVVVKQLRYMPITRKLHAYHSEAQMVVPIRRNSEINEVAQGRET
jgi:hypothetical protein